MISKTMLMAEYLSRLSMKSITICDQVHKILGADFDPDFAQLHILPEKYENSMKANVHPYTTAWLYTFVKQESFLNISFA